MSTAPSPTVLVVEDEAILRELLVDVLQTEGFAVEEAANGVEAIRAIDRLARAGERLGVILLDMMLPQVDGMDVLRYAKQVGASVPVVAMSASRRHLASALQAGASMSVPKPFNLDELVSAIETHCPHGQTRSMCGAQ